MWDLMASNALIYLILLSLLIMVVGSALARPERGVLGKPPTEPLDWTELAPLPTDLWLRMQRNLRSRAFPTQVLSSCVAEYSTRLTEAMRRIRSAN
jgi:hypothetical protein